MRFDRRLARTLAKDAGRLFVIAIAAELVVRTAAPEYAQQLFDNEYTGSYPMDINGDSYRGARVPQKKAPGELRVMALGDSVTFGTGVSSAMTYSAQIAKMDQNVTSIDGGFEGASVEDIVYSWDKKWSAYQPDLVVLALTGNMVSLEVVRRGKTFLPEDRCAELRPPASRLRRMTVDANRVVHRLALPSFGSIEVQRLLYWDGLLNHNVDPKWPYGAVLAHGWRQGDLDPALSEIAWERLASDVAQLRDRVSASGGKLVLTYVAPRFLLSDDAWDNQKNMPKERFTIDPVARASEIAARLGVAYIDAREALLRGRERIQLREHRRAPMYIYFDYAHLDEDGHRALARAITAMIDADQRRCSSATTQK